MKAVALPLFSTMQRILSESVRTVNMDIQAQASVMCSFGKQVDDRVTVAGLGSLFHRKLGRHHSQAGTRVRGMSVVVH